MRKINGKAFLLLLIGLALAAGAFWLLFAVQQRRIGEALRWQARHAEEDGDNARAARYLQRYLEFNPRDNQERATLARLWAGDGISGPPKLRLRAVQQMDKVLLTEDDPALRRLLVKTAIGLRDFNLARGHLQKLLPEEAVHASVRLEMAHHADQLLPPAKRKGVPAPEGLGTPAPERGELESYWGALLEDDKKVAEARSCYRLAMAHAPESLDAYVRLAYSLRRAREADAQKRRQNHDQANAAMDRMVANNGHSSEAYLTRWRYRRDFDLMVPRGKPAAGQVSLEAAAEDVVQAMRRNQKSVEVLLAAVDLERLSASAVSDDPARKPKQRQAGLKAHREKAFEYIARGLELVKARKGVTPLESGEFQFLWHKGSLLLDGLDLQPGQGDGKAPGLAAQKDEIEAVIAQVQKSGVVGAAPYMRGRLALHERRWADAAAQFEQARLSLSSQPSLAAQANLFLGKCYERLEQPTQMYEAFKRVIEHDPDSVPAHLGMAAAKAQQGRSDEAAREYRRLKDRGQVPPRAWVELARLEMQEQMRRDRPDWKEAENCLRQAARNNPNATVEVALLRAELLVRQGKDDEAKKALEDARAGQPDEAELWVGLAELAVRSKKPDEARRLIEEGKKKLHDRVPLRLALARLDGKKFDAEKWAAGREKFTEGEQARLLGGLAAIALGARDSKTAAGLWRQMTKLPRYADDLRLRRLLFSAALFEGDRGAMDEALASIKQIEKEGGSYHHFCLAQRAIWEARQPNVDSNQRAEFLAQARRELDAVQKARPAWGALFLARSEVSRLGGIPEQEIKDLEAATTNGENSPAVIRRLVTLLMNKGQDRQAQGYLKRLPLAAIQAGLRNEAVAVYIRNGDVVKALQITEQSMKEGAQGPAELVFLARVLSARGDKAAAEKRPDEAARFHADAEKRVDEAVRLAAGAAGPYVGRVEFLVERKRKKEALAAILDAEKNIVPKERPLALARCYELVNRPAKAWECYQEALKAGKDDPTVVRAVTEAYLSARRYAEAEPLLRRLADGDWGGKKAPRLSREWARHALAVVLSASTDSARFSQALALVGLKLGRDGKLPELSAADKPTDLVRAQARVLASQGHRQFRKQSLALLESLDRRGALQAEDRYLLALLYEAEGQHGRSQQRLLELAKSPLRTPAFLARYARGLISNKRVPNDLAEAERIIGLLEKMERQREVGPNGFATVELRARLLEARGKPDDALALMKGHVYRAGARPEEVVLLVHTMTRQKRYAEAYTLCELTWKEGKCPPEVVAAITTSLLQVMGPSDKQLAAVEARLRQTMKAKPGNVMLKLQLADLLDRRGNYREAAQLYRDVLKKEPNNFAALNNLAWMLAHDGGGNVKEALGHVNKALAGMGRRADLLDTRGLVYLALKEPGKAVADLKEAAEDGNSPQRLFHLARALDANNEREAAAGAIKRALQGGLVVASLHPVEQEAARDLLKRYPR